MWRLRMNHRLVFNRFEWICLKKCRLITSPGKSVSRRSLFITSLQEQQQQRQLGCRQRRARVLSWTSKANAGNITSVGTPSSKSPPPPFAHHDDSWGNKTSDQSCNWTWQRRTLTVFLVLPNKKITSLFFCPTQRWFVLPSNCCHKFEARLRGKDSSDKCLLLNDFQVPCSFNNGTIV